MLKINDKNLLRIIKAAQAGDMEAFGALYTYSYSRVYQTALIILRNKEDAEDVCQDIFIRVMENLSTLRIPEQYNFWLHRITVNQCLNFKRKRIPETDDLYDAEFMPDSSIDVDPFIKTLSNERQRILIKSLFSMSEVHRISFILKYYDDCKIEEIAAIFNCSPGTVKSRLNKARSLLKKSLQSHGINSGFLVTLPIGPALESWAQATLPSVQTTTQTFYQVTATKHATEGITLNPVEATKASRHFLLTGSGIFTATAASLVVLGGTAFGITALNTSHTAEVAAQPSAAPSFISPSIDVMS
ncbi:MAG: RNA polymerase sigma factor, partial [Eubacterium sp.]